MLLDPPAIPERPTILNNQGPRIWVEVDDLLRYFDAFAVPTGIGRVQLEILPRLLAAYPGRIGICRIGSHAGDVRAVPPEALATLLDGAKFLAKVESSSPAAKSVSQLWRYASRKGSALLDRLFYAGRARRAFQESVAAGDVILALGGSWTHVNFGRSLRALKARYGIRFALLVHDILPITHPEFVSASHRPNFVRWLEDMTASWDLVLTPSVSCASFLAAHLKQVGAEVPPIHPIPFGFGFGESAEQWGQADPIEAEPYVLYVSTIEVRKNHILLYRIWERLIEKHGRDRVPMLVFAGSQGWGVDKLRRLLSASNLLDGKIRIVSNLSDAQIARAYADCRFTVFPSLCEGWGLPVSESLYHGKLCVASNTTSVPEVGGQAVDYFDPTDEEAAFSAIERALFEPGYVEARERWIGEHFSPPKWDNTARAIFEILMGTAAETGAPSKVSAADR